MRLLKIKTKSKFRGLPPDFELSFSNNRIQDSQIEPICLVGLNGSGKSNSLELISELFYILERYAITDDDYDVKKLINEEKERFGNNYHSNGISFEIEYILDQSTWRASQNLWRESVINWNDVEYVRVKIDKRGFEPPLFFIYNGITENTSYRKIDDNRHWKILLPFRIIGYSSGQNELISNPYIKMDQFYFDSLERKIRASKKGGVEEEYDVNRMFFMDYEGNKLTTLANYLIPNISKEDALSRLNKELKINGIKQFSISLKLYDYRKSPVELSTNLSTTINNLKACATTWQDDLTGPTKDRAKSREIFLFFNVNGATQEAFKRRFGDSFSLYKALYQLRLLNIHNYSSTLRDEIRKAKAGVNLSSIIPQVEESKKIFSIDEIAFNKRNVEEPVYYRQLSDGEHQLLHVLGLVVLMNEPGTIFLLDEPETHFNPDWRGKFVTLLNECTTERIGKGHLKRRANQQEFLLTTHSPFVISDCKRNNVYVFNRKLNSREIYYRHPSEETFGASVVNILDDCFDYSHLVGSWSSDKIKQAAKSNNIDKLDQSMDKFGNSILRNRLILQKLNQLYVETQINKKK